MPMENMVHMFGGTKKKSTLVDENVIFFPREDEGSPRQVILDNFCKEQVFLFRECMTKNDNDENKCSQTKRILDVCSADAFAKVNTDPKW
eukprot:CAMPEP_0168321286 /NCGR_PEP_ID=MMETSP0213-20121227/2180_1 /TAXON_ID=151035 /ORGANISM="Euplotes harpa, Strain FSP1.4" /LENGTH=89 /DNA_ID=CAMNT_0008322907 /DNA_START=26 /DNA_END=292 /DNA_ORIENTATION=-